MRGPIGHVYSDGLNLEGDRTVFGKHGCYHVDDNIQLGLVRRCCIDEDIGSLAWHDLGICPSARNP